MLTIHYGTTAEIEYKGIIFHIQGPDFDVLHNHDFYEFTMVMNGEYTNVIDDENTTLSKYSTLFLTPEIVHRIKSTNPESMHLNILINKEKFEHICQAMFPSLLGILKTRKVIHSNTDIQMMNKILLYLDMIKIADSKSVETISSMIICLLIESLMSVVILESMVPYPPHFADILKQCNSAKNLRWKSTDVSKYANYSSTHINRLFKKYINLSVTEYLTNIKMDSAKNLLATTNYSVSEIAHMLGYSSVSYFNKIFTRTYKSTPYKYKLNLFRRIDKNEQNN